MLTACSKELKTTNILGEDVSDTSISTASSEAESTDVETSSVDEVLDAVDAAKEGTDIVEISEKMFMTQISDIFYNIDDYNGKIIKVQGMYTATEYEDGSVLNFVYRNGPGCCGNDGWGGFLLNYDGEYPNENDWIEVMGTLEIVEDEEYTDIYLNVTSLEVMDERGQEVVSQ